MAAPRLPLSDFARVARYLASWGLRPPQFEGARPTARRLGNLYHMMWEATWLRTRLRSYPVRLCVESTGACNLSCPHCFTGAGEIGRPRRAVPSELYHSLLTELGDYLWQIEFCNWGEPLLNRETVPMIAAAARRGISTLICTNFSVPFDAERAEALVASGLHVLGVSIDGARQETYEQYRVGGVLNTVLRNCELVMQAKRRLNSSTPRLIWAFHVFPFNREDVELARNLATGLGMDFHASRGRVVGEDWDPDALLMPHEHVEPAPCPFLWHTATVFSDGGVAPCRGSFFPQDDMGTLTPGRTPAAFRDIWNGDRFQLARRFYGRREGTDTERQHICFGCPHTIDHEHYRSHVQNGGTRAQWSPTINSNRRYNYFWNRRPPGAPERPRVRRQ